MPRKKSKDEFVEVSSHIHKNKYDYSKVDYINSQTKVCIICPIHGEFWQTPAAHIHQQQGCSRCRSESMKKKVCGVGINDYSGSTKIKDRRIKSYQAWQSMLSRCYMPKEQQKHPSYIGCYVCDEWLYFSNFKKWFDENYRDGYEMDKDLLSNGLKCYSPQTCLFVPVYINNLIRTRNDNKNKMGVFYDKKSKKYIAKVSFNGRTEYSKVFDNMEDAYNEYKKKKIALIKRVAETALSKGDIDEKVYNALLKYKIK